MSGNEVAARKRAEAFRAEHELGLAAVKDVFELVHAATGIDVLSMDAHEAEHGLSMRDPESGRTVIAVATTSSPMRQRSSVAHELGHVLAGDLDRAARGDLAGSGERTDAEIQADAFARHLLLPLGAVRDRAGAGASGRSLVSALVQEFEVSPAVAAIQMRDAGVVGEADFQHLAGMSAPAVAAEFGWLSQYHSLAAGSRQPRAPQGLMARAVAGYRRGVLGLAEVAMWYSQDPADLEAELGEAVPGDVVIDDEWDSEEPLFPSASATR